MSRYNAQVFKFITFIVVNFFSVSIAAIEEKPVASTQNYDIQMKTQIKSNAEQPNLIFILPWKKDLSPSLPNPQADFGYFNHFLTPVNQEALELERKVVD